MENETKRALKGMGSWKAPGPNGYQLGFLKKTWEATGQDVHKFVQGVLNGDDVSEEDTEAILVLVPKATKPSLLKNFRPVSLCNIRIKLVTKVLANKLKLLLKELISPN